jgi:hypothetical protein
MQYNVRPHSSSARIQHCHCLLFALLIPLMAVGISHHTLSVEMNHFISTQLSCNLNCIDRKLNL